MERRLILGALVAAAGSAQEPAAAASDEQWAKFLDWAGALPPQQYTQPDLPERYAKQMGADGLAEALRRRLKTAKELTGILYDRSYNSKQRMFADGPTAFLASTIKTVNPGKALDIGMGEGRNSIYMAQQGWDVTGLDLSQAGIDIARKKSAGLKLNAMQQDVDLFDFGAAQWDLVALLYFSGYPYMHDIETRIVQSLRPGGLMIWEAPSLNRENPFAPWQAWQKLGLKPLHLEFHAGKAEWGQPAYLRMLGQKA
jgi:SAM-dependent methyltransferase